MDIVKISEYHKKHFMETFFDKRTNEHIARVKKFAKLIEEYDPDRFEGLIEQAKTHDDSKFEEPEYTPYLYIIWDYKCKAEGKKFDIPEEMRNRISKATEHHVSDKRNRHHPECHSPEKVSFEDRQDRDKPGRKIVDATRMKDIDIGEMVSDWFAMSEEKNSNPKEWADKNVNIRWKFTDEHKELIYELIEEVWK